MGPESDRERGPERLPAASGRGRRAALFVVAGAATALVAVGVAAIDGAPYLSADSINPGLVAYAIGLFTALFAAPFAIHTRLGGRLEADARWERSLLLWGAVSLGLLAVGLVLVAGGGLDSASLAGSLGAVTVAEALLVIATLAVWLVSG